MIKLKNVICQGGADSAGAVENELNIHFANTRL